MKPEERDAAYLWDMLAAARESQVLVEGVTLEMLMSDLRTRRALERTLELVGEAAARVSSQTRSTHTEIPWAAIIGQRNIIAHRYAAIDYGLLFATVTGNVPKLISVLERIIGKLER
jgi:uncharacterized protein with HEPN domain